MSNENVLPCTFGSEIMTDNMAMYLQSVEVGGGGGGRMQGHRRRVKYHYFSVLYFHGVHKASLFFVNREGNMLNSTKKRRTL